MSSLLAAFAQRSHTEPAPYPHLLGDCRIWDGETSQRGYGRAHELGIAGYVHRLAWIETNGPVPDGLLVLHRCDRRLCWADEHLWVGTPRQNYADMLAKGRQPAWNTGGAGRRKRQRRDVEHCRRGHPRVDDRGCEHGRHCAPAAAILRSDGPISALVREFVLDEWDAGRAATPTITRARFPEHAGYAASFARRMRRHRAAILALRAADPSPTPPPQAVVTTADTSSTDWESR